MARAPERWSAVAQTCVKAERGRGASAERGATGSMASSLDATRVPNWPPDEPVPKRTSPSAMARMAPPLAAEPTDAIEWPPAAVGASADAGTALSKGATKAQMVRPATRGPTDDGTGSRSALLPSKCICEETYAGQPPLRQDALDGTESKPTAPKSGSFRGETEAVAEDEGVGAEDGDEEKDGELEGDAVGVPEPLVVVEDDCDDDEDGETDGVPEALCEEL
jgi:hypothetical protein